MSDISLERTVGRRILSLIPPLNESIVGLRP